MVTEFRARRDLLVSGLRGLGIPCSIPGGAFYVFPDVSEFGGGDLFTEKLLKDALIAATPGSAFGPGGVELCATLLCYITGQDKRGAGENREDAWVEVIEPQRINTIF